MKVSSEFDIQCVYTYDDGILAILFVVAGNSRVAGGGVVLVEGRKRSRGAANGLPSNVLVGCRVLLLVLSVCRASLLDHRRRRAPFEQTAVSDSIHDVLSLETTM
jgi:hypothetical protein